MPKTAALQSVFDWDHPMDLSADTIQQMGLVKGVVMQEGDARFISLKDGTVKKIGTLTRDNVTFGAGGLTAIARSGAAVIDIDHHRDALPAEYTKKYPGINTPYPVAHILDAQAVERDGKMVVEIIAAVHNRAVFKMIQEGKIKGNSVTVHHRRDDDPNCAANGSCEFSGATFERNSFMLEEIPAMPGTWIAPVEPADIGANLKMAEHRMASATTALLLPADEDHDDHEHKLDTKDEIIKHLTAREITDDMAADIADYIIATPDAFNRKQLLGMQKDDWETWWTKSGSQSVRIFKLEQQVRAMSAAEAAPAPAAAEPEPVKAPEPEAPAPAPKDEVKDAQLKKEDVMAWLKENKYQEPQPVEEPQTVPQTAAPETEKVDAPPPAAEPEPTEAPAPEPAPAEPEPAVMSMKYTKGGDTTTQDEVGIAKIMGMLGGLQTAHNRIVVSPYSGQSRRFSMQSMSAIRSDTQNLIYTLQNDHGIRLQMDVRNNKMRITPAN